MTGFHQQPAPFALGDVVEAPGVRFTGNRARCYHLLRESKARGHRHRIGRRTGPPGWVPAFLFQEPWSGGSSGLRRVRELRTKYGCEIEIEDFATGDESKTSIYRLGADPLIPSGATETRSAAAPALSARYTFVRAGGDVDLTPSDRCPSVAGYRLELDQRKGELDALRDRAELEICLSGVAAVYRTAADWLAAHGFEEVRR